MIPTYFDSHCHFDFEAFDKDRDNLWQQCQDAGLKQLLIPGTGPKQWQRACALTEQYKGLYTAAGFHPWWLNDVNAIDKPLLEAWHKTIAHPNCIAIGECGLDKTIDTDIDRQTVFFEAHLQLACELKLPLIVHVRKSHNETLRLLQHYKPTAGGIIHGFSGSLELAQQYWRLDFALGIGGTITYSRANKTRNTVKHLPLEAMVLETDAPDMPLAGFQGQRNTPLQLVAIAQTLAELRDETLDAIAETTTHNARQLFSL